MPAYDFICEDCDHTFTLKRSFAQAGDPTDCPQCAGDHTRKVFTAVAFNRAGGASRPPDAAPSQNGGCCSRGVCGCGH